VSTVASARPWSFGFARGLLRRWPLGLALISVAGVVAVPYALVARGT
jgi:hypothetical protein